MRQIKKLFFALWALWGFLWFMLVVLLATPFYAIALYLFGRKMAKACIWINGHVLSPIILTMSLIRVKVHNRERVDKHGTYVFVANHGAQIDIPAGAMANPIAARFLAKSEIQKIPMFGYMVKMIGIYVDRRSKESREKAYRYMIEALQHGESIFIYPEGTRNRTDQPLKEFKDGAFKVAVLAQVPIMVQTLVNTRELNDPRGYHLKPGTVHVYWSEPISTIGLTEADIPALKDKVRGEMLRHLQ